MYKRQIYQIAESNRKNRFGSENRIETFFARIGMLYQMHTLQNQVKSKVRIKAQRQKLNCHRRLPRRPVSSNWPAATPTGHFLSGPLTPTGHFLSGPLSGPSARHVLVRPAARQGTLQEYSACCEFA